MNLAVGSSQFRSVFPLLILLGLFIAQSGQSLVLRTPSRTPQVLLLQNQIDLLAHSVTAGNYLASAVRGKAILDSSASILPSDLLLKLKLNLGAAQMGSRRYRDALENFLAARILARKSRNFRTLYAADNNISWIYLNMDDPGSAAEFADEALTAMRAGGKYDPRLAILRGLIYAKCRDFAKAEPLFAESVNRSLDAGDVSSAASAWNFLGAEYFNAGLIQKAEFAQTECFRLRKLHHLSDLDVSLRSLGKIYAARGDVRKGLVLMDEAMAALRDPRSTAPTWVFFLERGRLRAMEGDYAQALPDLRSALELARRLDVVSTDDDRVTFNSGLADLYSLFIDTGNHLYLAGHDRRLRDEIFEAAEESRAASLRALVPQPNGWRSRLPAEHAVILASLQAAERKTLFQDDPQAAAETRSLRASLQSVESKAGSDEETGKATAIDSARRALGPDSAIVTFHLGSQGSWLWAMTQESFDVLQLAPEAELARDAADFRSAVRNGSANIDSLGDRLGRKLLGNLPAAVHKKTRWILALDQELFDLPFAALRWQGRYLAEEHSLLLTPSIRMLQPDGTQPRLSGRMIGLGDAIYNRMDARWGSSEPYGFFSPHAAQLHLARLSGSGEEVKTALSIWGTGNTYTGAAVNRVNLARALAAQPSILHLATHVIHSTTSRSGLLVLTLNRSGDAEFLDMRDILLHPTNIPLVVMSGCASGDGEALASNGLMGLTRAWLGAGATQVLSTRWAVLDDNGLFFAAFYRNLRNYPEAGAAEALRQAQLQMIRSNNFRRRPDYWAGYFLVGKV